VDSGDTRSGNFTEEFAKKLNIPHISKTLEEMVDK